MSDRYVYLLHYEGCLETDESYGTLREAEQAAFDKIESGEIMLEDSEDKVLILRVEKIIFTRPVPVLVPGTHFKKLYCWPEDES